MIYISDLTKLTEKYPLPLTWEQGSRGFVEVRYEILKNTCLLFDGIYSASGAYFETSIQKLQPKPKKGWSDRVIITHWERVLDPKETYGNHSFWLTDYTPPKLLHNIAIVVFFYYQFLEKGECLGPLHFKDICEHDVQYYVSLYAGEKCLKWLFMPKYMCDRGFTNDIITLIS